MATGLRCDHTNHCMAQRVGRAAGSSSGRSTWLNLQQGQEACQARNLHISQPSSTHPVHLPLQAALHHSPLPCPTPAHSPVRAGLCD